MTALIEESARVRRDHRSPDSERRSACLRRTGGSASFFFPASAQLSSVTGVLAVQYPGRRDRCTETSPDDLGVLADEAYEELAKPLRERPRAFFGHSLRVAPSFEDGGVVRSRRGPVAPAGRSLRGAGCPPGTARRRCTSVTTKASGRN